MLAFLAGSAAASDDRFTVCSITINSDDEIRTLQSRLPASTFRFVELTDFARTTVAEGEPTWFGRACRSGVQCDVLVVSGHFGNTWAGDYGTTFAGTSGISLPLEELEQRRCEQTCPGILANPREVFLFGCKTLSEPAVGQTLPPPDVAAFGRHDVAPANAARILDEVKNHGEGTSSRERMQYVFGGVPHVYGFTEVAPAGKRVAPLLDEYLRNVGDYSAHLRRLRPPESEHPIDANTALARALQPTCFTQASGLDPHGAQFAREDQTCALRDERRSVVERFARLARLVDAPGFVTYLPSIGAFLRAHGAPADAQAIASLHRVGENADARGTALALLRELRTPVVRLELVRVARSVGWLSAQEALPIERQIAVELLRPPIWGEGRDLICGMDRDVLEQLDVRAEDVAPELYRNEFGIQALGCLKPVDERIHERLAASLGDSREWIRNRAAAALKVMSPVRLAGQPAPQIH